MLKIDRKMVMLRAWNLFRGSMIRFSRAAFAECLRKAWSDLRNAPVTAYPVLQRYATVAFGAPREEVIRALERALAFSRSSMARYSRAGGPAGWSAGKHRSADIQRVCGLETLLATEKRAADLAA